jgi:uncharacterized membrane protein
MAGDESADSGSGQAPRRHSLALRVMPEILTHWFAVVCGQNPGHTWAPGGILLPCCQRCTGLYVGAAVAVLLHLWLRPRLSGRFLEIHGAFLLAMVPFGFHWVPQGPTLRTLSGVLFGFAVATFLWLPLSQTVRAQACRNMLTHWHREATYCVIWGATLIVLPTTAMLGGTFAAYGLSGLAFCGALALAALVIGDISLALAGAFRLLRCLSRPRTQR